MTLGFLFKVWISDCFNALRLRLERWKAHREACEALARKAYRRRA